MQFSVEPRHYMLLGEQSGFPRPASQSGGVRALRATASLAAPAI